MFVALVECIKSTCIVFFQSLYSQSLKKHVANGVVWWLVNMAVSEMSILRMRACGTLCSSKIHICSMQLSVYKGTICTFFPIILGLAFSGLIMIFPLPVYLPTVWHKFCRQMSFQYLAGMHTRVIRYSVLCVCVCVCVPVCVSECVCPTSHTNISDSPAKYNEAIRWSNNCHLKVVTHCKWSPQTACGSYTWSPSATLYLVFIVLCLAFSTIEIHCYRVYVFQCQLVFSIRLSIP